MYQDKDQQYAQREAVLNSKEHVSESGTERGVCSDVLHRRR